ncbi:MAG: hypothetical protein C5B59_19685 [Bacteroidetes bacterium]|nr:MAG: hypothetical protein C5B59_19685 [Bacteroidota bacterium]
MIVRVLWQFYPEFKLRSLHKNSFRQFASNLRNFFLFFVASSVSVCGYAQHTLRVRIKDARSLEPLVSTTVLVRGINIAAIADDNGTMTLKNIPDGKQVIIIRHVGYKETYDSLVFPLSDTSIRTVFLQPKEGELGEVVVSATRSSRTIGNIPTRIETISGEELEEQSVSNPGNVRMILSESTGIQAQQTSATSANSSIRIQGLDGKYTLLLKDGFPLYTGYSTGLSIIQIPPLDLKRVEVIKGASSTLYGGGAIAGLVNFVSKVPTGKKELSFLVNGNQTNAGDVSGFYAQKFKKIGITLYSAQNWQAAYDVDKDGLSDIPKFSRFTINPKVFYYVNNSTTVSLGANANFENRLGGDMRLIQHKNDSTHSYFEKNLSTRLSTQLQFEKKFSGDKILNFKNSIGYFDRTITKPGYLFSGKQVSSFSELSYLLQNKRSEWIVGGNVWTDNFTQTNVTAYPLNSSLTTLGTFVQNNFKVSEKIILESGLRIDGTDRQNYFFLPRISAMYKISTLFTTRIGGGLGYKTPSIFSEEAEEKGYQNIEPLDLSKVSPERSVGANIDFNFRKRISDEASVSVNQLFFYTRLKSPLVLSEAPLPDGNFEFYNADGYLDSKGSETNLKLDLDDISVYVGYTFTDARRHYNNTDSLNPLTAKDRLYVTLSYEIEGKLRVGYELFYTGEQLLSNGQTRPNFWVMGMSAEYSFKHFSLFVNAENFTDTRQTKYESIYTGTIRNPQFKEIWAPTDGFIFNGGFKIRVW